ncbi:MAG: DinB family protein [Rhodothermales bacterium]
MPDSARVEAAELRAALLDQLAYLMDEVETLRAVVGRVPEPLQAARPLDQGLSIKEAYGLLAALDETVYLPRFRQMITGNAPSFDPVDERTLAMQGDWNNRPIEHILQRVQDARRTLVAFLQEVPPEAWSCVAHFGEVRRDLYGLAYHITQHDVDLQRAVGYRLHEIGT